jgi:hypothetical protein
MPDPCALTAVRYLLRRDSIELTFASGGTMTVPRRAITEFEGLPTDALNGLGVSAAGDALRELRNYLVSCAKDSSASRAMLMGLRGTHPVVDVILAAV